jgi:outer membrane protein X
MKVLFKAAMVLVVATASVMNVSAQEKGDMAAGLNAAVGMGDELTNFGIGAKFQYNILDPLRLEGSFTYFLPKTWGAGFAEAKLSMWDFSVNAHYLFPMSESLAVYPLAGVGMLGTSSSVEVDFGGYGGLREYGSSVSTSEFGFNLGGGLDFRLTEQFILNAEVKYKICGTWSRLMLSAGVAYRF